MIGCRTDGSPGRGHAISFLTRLLFAIYFLETGLLLVVAPWTAWWTQNLVADALPWLHAIMASGLVRVGVVGLGILTFAAGAAEVWRMFTRRPLQEEIPSDLSSPRA